MDVKPLVSIAMTTYNGEMYLEEQLNSIYSQTYKNIEVIVCDDCSSDTTLTILKKFSENFGLIFYTNEKNIGFKKNFEKTISLCNGEYIALADQDDIWEAEKIDILIKEIGSYDLIHSACSLIDETSKQIAPMWIKYDNFESSFIKSIFGNTVTGCTVLFKKRILQDFFPIPSGEEYHDWWLALLASKQNGIKYCNKVLVQYRQHSSQDTGVTSNSLVAKLQRYSKSLLFKKNSKRFKKAQQQLVRLNSFLNEKKDIFTDKEINIIKDAIVYNENYLNNFFHFKSFLISYKYHRYLYPSSKYYIKNIFRDLLG